MGQVKSLNSVGISKFEEWLDNPTGAAPKVLLQNEMTTDFVDGGYQIDLSRQFSNSFELGEYLARHVFVGPVNRFSLLSNNGMWAWISLVFIESLLRKVRNAGKPLAKPHYIVQSQRLAYRLIVRTAWDLVSLHGDAAKVALGSPKSPWGEIAEQMTARQEIYAHRSFWPVASALYALQDGSVKTGVTTKRTAEARKDPKNKTGLGGVGRLPTTFKQFERTYNLRKMTSDKIVALLPIEYNKWRAGN